MSRAPVPRPLPLRPQAYRPRIKAMETAPSAWTVFIEGLEVSASIGVHPHEHETRQHVRVDVTLDMTGAPTPKNDRLAETADYEALAQTIEELAREGHVQLVETLAERIARAALRDPRAVKARVRVAKPAALPNAKAVGCEVVVERR
jgi:dihydroneopterin aldolase